MRNNEVGACFQIYILDVVLLDNTSGSESCVEWASGNAHKSTLDIHTEARQHAVMTNVQKNIFMHPYYVEFLAELA